MFENVLRHSLSRLIYLEKYELKGICLPVFAGTVYWQAEGRDGILLMSAYCVYCCASPLFLSSVLMAHLNKALGVSSNTDSSPGFPFWLERGADGIAMKYHAPVSRSSPDETEGAWGHNCN